MRFKEYISESKAFDFDKFIEDCKFFFDQLEHLGYLRHGSKTAPNDFDIVQFKERSGPRDSPQALHNMVNEFYKDRFGFPYRNGLFATGKYSNANTYGPVSVIFPIGKFEWLTTPEIEDMTGIYERYVDRIKHKDPEMEWDERADMAAKMVMTELKNSKFYHNEELWMCTNFGSEVMIKCDKYYRFNEYGDTWENLRTKLSDYFLRKRNEANS